MSVRKRIWQTKGDTKEAWVVDYFDNVGKRRLKTFGRKKDADHFAATAHVEVRDGLHVADSATVTVSEAGILWLRSGAENGLRQVIAADPSFDVVQFVEGGKAAYRMILEAFWKGDRETQHSAPGTVVDSTKRKNSGRVSV